MSSSPDEALQEKVGTEKEIINVHIPLVPTPHMRACLGSWRTMRSYSLCLDAVPEPLAMGACEGGGTVWRGIGGSKGEERGLCTCR